jgi:hypothetical protein
MKRYAYFFTRQDISPEQQIVQTAHAAMKLGFKLNEQEDPNSTYFTVIGVRNREALSAVDEIISTFGFKYEAFVEPDLNGGEVTSIALYPVTEDKRGILLAFNLLSIGRK